MIRELIEEILKINEYNPDPKKGYVTKEFKISAPKEVMQRFENFLCFLHFNGGHSGLFAMSFDGDGADTFKCDPEPEKSIAKGNKDKDSVTGYDVEIANGDGYQGLSVEDKSKSYSDTKMNEQKVLSFMCRKLNEGQDMLSWAENELEKAGLFDEDSDYNGMLGDSALELVKVFSEQGHSGCSAELARELFNRLSSYKALTPLTDDPEEWMDVSEYDPDDPNLYQSRRDPECFSRDGGITYYKLSDGSNAKEVKKSYKSECSGKRGYKAATQ